MIVEFFVETFVMAADQPAQNVTYIVENMTVVNRNEVTSVTNVENQNVATGENAVWVFFVI